MWGKGRARVAWKVPARRQSLTSGQDQARQRAPGMGIPVFAPAKKPQMASRLRQLQRQRPNVGANMRRPGDAATGARSAAIWLGGKRCRSALGVYLGTGSTGDDASNTAPGNLFGHLGSNLVEHHTLLVGCHTTLFELKLRSVNDGEGRPQLGMQAQGLRTRQAQESFCAIDFR